MTRLPLVWLSTALVLTVSGAASAQNANMGATYDALQASASTITTTFTDDCIATTRQQPAGVFATEVRQGVGSAVGADVHLTFAPLTRRLTLGGPGGGLSALA
jgi:hypothetical protein